MINNPNYFINNTQKNIVFCQKKLKNEDENTQNQLLNPETEPDSFIKTIDKEINKKSTKKAIGIGAGVVLISGLSMIFNPRFSPKIVNKIKLLEQQTKNKILKSKGDITSSKAYEKWNKFYSKIIEIMEFSNNINSVKDIGYKRLCSKNFEFSNVKNKTVRNILKKMQSGFIFLTKKPNEFITNFFDQISIKTVKNKFKAVNKRMDKLDEHILLIRESLSAKDKTKVDKLLAELRTKREFFTEDNLMKRLKIQDNGMENLEQDVLKKLDDWTQGFENITHVKENYDHVNNNFKFWAQDSLMDFRKSLEKNGIDAVENLVGNNNGTTGIYKELFDIISQSKNVSSENKTLMSKAITKLNKRLLKASDVENVQYFDKKRDLKLGSAPTDIVTNFSILGLSLGFLAAASSKEERRTRAMTGVFPAVGGIATNLLFTAKLYAGITGMLMGGVSSIILSKLGNLGNKFLFNHDVDKIEEDKKNKQLKHHAKKQQSKQEVQNV